MPTQSYADSSDCTLTVLSSILRDWLSAFRAQVRKNSAAALLKTMTTPCPLPAVMSARYPLDQQTCLLNISSFSGGGDTSFVWAHHPLSLARIRWAVPVAVEEEIIAPSRKEGGCTKKALGSNFGTHFRKGWKNGKTFMYTTYFSMIAAPITYLPICYLYCIYPRYVNSGCLSTLW